ncbi:MAG: hypothetical protein J0L52_06050 [Caulobacterales bacterium]|nr:hypothetical protein [Caulobacterales bacterium]
MIDKWLMWSYEKKMTNATNEKLSIKSQNIIDTLNDAEQAAGNAGKETLHLSSLADKTNQPVFKKAANRWALVYDNWRKAIEELRKALSVSR